MPSITLLPQCGRYCQADVLFCDVDPNTGLITPETLRNAIQDARERGLNIKAVIAVPYRRHGSEEIKKLLILISWN